MSSLNAILSNKYAIEDTNSNSSCTRLSGNSNVSKRSKCLFLSFRIEKQDCDVNETLEFQ